MSDVSYVKYVPHHLVEDHEANGWSVLPCRPDHHSAWAVSMIYDGDGDPPWMSERLRFKDASDRVAEARERGNEAEIAEAMMALATVAWNLTDWVMRDS